MDRKEFLEKMGIGAAFALTATCLGSCTKDQAAVAKDVDFTIDLTDTKYDELRAPGGYIVENDIVIARSTAGSIGYIAASITCSHNDLKEIIYDGSKEEWFCTAHGARYTTEGEGLNAFGQGGLVVYNTSLDGDTLRVFE